MKKMLFIMPVVVIVLLVVNCSRPVTEYDYLLEPQISFKDKSTVITSESGGTPEEIFEMTMKPLFTIYMKLRKENKGMSMRVAPIGRWPVDPQTPREQWYATIALPVPSGVTELPDEASFMVPAVRLQEWYGSDVAEILHVGSYESETETILKLKEFIADQGYTITGVHEEEYVKGPGMFFKGNPDKYKTIIRYEVGK
jgi:hypothetical protein